MAGFNLMGLMNQASKTEAGAPKYELKRLNINELYPDPQNKTVYSVENIEELADAIEIAGGVLHNLVVRAVDETGKYMIISGERRWTACKLLVNEKRRGEFSEVNCLIENEHDEDILDLMLMLTNSTARQLSDAEKMRQAERMTDILNRMKEQQGLEGRVRDIVSKMLQMSSTQLARYHAIAKNLQNKDLKQAFQDGRLKVSAAYEASQLSEEGQQKVADKLQEEGTVSLNHVTIVKHKEREDEPGWSERMAKVEEHRKQDRLNAIKAKAENIEADKKRREKAREEQQQQIAAEKEDNALELEAVSRIRDMLSKWQGNMDTIEQDNPTLRERLQKEIMRLEDEINWRKSRQFD